MIVGAYKSSVAGAINTNCDTHFLEARTMTIEQGLRMAAGIVVLTSVALAVLVSPYWLLLTAFAGLNLLQSSLTNWCPMVWVLAQLGLKPCGWRAGDDTPPAAAK